MKIFVVYKWDCIIRWGLFGLVVLLVLLSSDAVALIDNPTALSAFTIGSTRLFELLRHLNILRL